MLSCNDHHFILNRLSPPFFGKISEKITIFISKRAAKGFPEKKKQSLSVNVVGVLLYKIILDIVTKVIHYSQN